jgi:hypothetical protein
MKTRPESIPYFRIWPMPFTAWDEPPTICIDHLRNEGKTIAYDL